jgi:hypothetical protein
VTESPPGRANRDGHPCPPWCTIDHDQELIPGRFSAAHGADTASRRVTEREYVSARPCQTPSRSPEVQVTWSGHDSIFLAPAGAECLAGLLDVIADAAPADVRELAAAIRQAAAQITDAEAQP